MSIKDFDNSDLLVLVFIVCMTLITIFGIVYESKNNQPPAPAVQEVKP